MGAVFFVLAYVELFTAGKYLPGGPFASVSGSMDILWNPQWNMIAIYAFHCLLACILMTISLLRIDGNYSRAKLIVRFVTILLAWLAVPWIMAS